MRETEHKITEHKLRENFSNNLWYIYYSLECKSYGRLAEKVGMNRGNHFYRYLTGESIPRLDILYNMVQMLKQEYDQSITIDLMVDGSLEEYYKNSRCPFKLKGEKDNGSHKI